MRNKRHSERKDKLKWPTKLIDVTRSIHVNETVEVRVQMALMNFEWIED